MKKYYIVYSSVKLIQILTMTEVELFKKAYGICAQEIKVSLAARRYLQTWTSEQLYLLL